MRDDAHFLAIVPHWGQGILGKVRRLLVVADGLPGHAQNASGGAIVERERAQQLTVRRRQSSSEALQKNRKAPERRPAKTVNRLAMIADHYQVGPLAAQQPKQFELRDVGVLKFVHEQVAVARAKPI